MENFEQGFSRFRVHNYRSNNEPVILSDHNETTRFDGRTDEEFINSSTHQTNLPIEVLISNPEPRRKREEGKIPRPLNMWIIYRRDKNENPEFKGLKLKASVVTKKVRVMWDNEPEGVKEFYAALSRLAVKNHIKRFGKDYKYRPGPYKKSKSKQRKERNRNSPPSSGESSPNISELTDIISQIFPTPSLESMQASPISSPELQLPTPESNFHSPTSSTSLFLDFEEDSSELELFPPLSAISPKSNQELSSAQLSTHGSELEKLLHAEQDITAYLEENLNNSNTVTNDDLNDWLNQMDFEEILDTTMNSNANEHLHNQNSCNQLYTNIDYANNINLQNYNDINGQFINQINGSDQSFNDFYIQQNFIGSHFDQSYLNQINLFEYDLLPFDENSDHFDYFTRQPSQ